MAELVHQTWSRVTGKAWSEASKGGFTDGSSQSNLALQKKLLGGYNPYAPAPAAQSQEPAPVPSQGQGVTDYLNDFQRKVADAMDPVKLRESAQALTASLTPTTQAPQLLDRTALRKQLVEENGISQLEEQLNALKAQEEEVIAQQRTRISGEENKTVGLNVISGRVGEVQRQENERLDVIGRAKSRITNELQTRYTIVQTMMEDETLDYQDAIKAYESEWNRNMQMTQFVYSQAKDKIDIAFKEQDAARANLNIYTDLITKGGLNLANASADQKLMINRLEIQAGLAPGTMAGLSAAQQGFKIHSTVNRVDPNGNQYLDVVYVDGSGAMKVENKLLGKAKVTSSGGSSSTTKEERKISANASLREDLVAAYNSNEYKTIPGYTEKTLLPQLYRLYPDLSTQEINDAVYQIRSSYE